MAIQKEHYFSAQCPGGDGVKVLETGGRLLQVSTDFVFNGSQGSPYRPEQAS